ncbi:MAG: hypothetical protein ISR57_02605 [Bacteroidales bacterium]|nr:hypothetical protein [Bacteroidota bacterium]MBL6949511.1 hypothetical protein [Bacteroidales bacterium]
MKLPALFGFFVILPVIVLLATGCKKDKPTDEPSQQTLILQFDFLVDGEGLQADTMIYVNEAGNHYMVNEIQFFISDVKLNHSEGNIYQIQDSKTIHYIDSDLPETQSWHVSDNIPAGTYSSISFIFGINEEKNQSLIFPNPPESFMFWPEHLGGGYHYMKLNGKWLDENQQVRPFNFHLGIGQIYYSFPDSISGFVQNYFQVALPNSSFTLEKNQTRKILITMNIENWFRSPHTYDHDVWGGMIMQNQEAMKMACENGADVFTVIIE